MRKRRTAAHLGLQQDLQIPVILLGPLAQVHIFSKHLYAELHNFTLITQIGYSLVRFRVE